MDLDRQKALFADHLFSLLICRDTHTHSLSSLREHLDWTVPADGVDTKGFWNSHGGVWMAIPHQLRYSCVMRIHCIFPLLRADVAMSPMGQMVVLSFPSACQNMPTLTWLGLLLCRTCLQLGVFQPMTALFS